MDPFNFSDKSIYGHAIFLDLFFRYRLFFVEKYADMQITLEVENQLAQKD